MAWARQKLLDFSDLTQDRKVPSPLALASGPQTFRVAEASVWKVVPALLEVPKVDRPAMLT
jgi:hypothetical protein